MIAEKRSFGGHEADSRDGLKAGALLRVETRRH